MENRAYSGPGECETLPFINSYRSKTLFLGTAALSLERCLSFFQTTLVETGCVPMDTAHYAFTRLCSSCPSNTSIWAQTDQLINLPPRDPNSTYCCWGKTKSLMKSSLCVVFRDPQKPQREFREGTYCRLITKGHTSTTQTENLLTHWKTILILWEALELIIFVFLTAVWRLFYGPNN